MRTLLVPMVLLAVSLPTSSEAASWRTALRNAQRNAAAVLERGLDQVEATPKQRTEIRKHLARVAVDLWSLRGEAIGLQDAFAAALLADEPDEGELDRIEKDGVELLTRGARVTRTGVLQAAAVLTPKQRKELLHLWRGWVRQVAGS